MSNELIPVDARAQEVVKYEDVAKSEGFMPRLALQISSSEVCKSGEFPINHFALIQGKDYEDLGAEVDVVVCAWRPKALRIGDDDIEESFDINSETYQAIKKEADVQDSGCMHGPEYLVWLPEKNIFASMFWGSKTGRRESRTIHGLMNCAATLKAKRCEGKSYVWYTATADSCNSLTQAPDLEILKEQIEAFINPKPRVVAEKDDGEQTDRER